MSWQDCKNSGPWEFTEQPDKFGYLNNERWSSQQDAIDFCKAKGLPLDDPNQHLPCGHWHKVKVSEAPFPSGRWVAAMQQPGTPYIYVYDILHKAVIQIDTSEIPVFVSGRLELDSAYTLDYDMGYGNPGAQRGGYCMNKDGTKIWYLFCDQEAAFGPDRPDAQLIEINISDYTMEVVKKTLFPGLLPGLSPGSFDKGRICDACSDDTYTYWCTDLVAGRIIKIRNSDHSIIDDHYFNYSIEACSGISADEPIATIDVNKSTGKLYWVYCRDHLNCTPVYNACRHLIRADIDLVADNEEIVCGTGFHAPSMQNMIKICSDYVLHHRTYYPPTGPFVKRELNFSKEDTVAGTAFYQWGCIKDHVAALSNRPTSGAEYATYWRVWDEQPGGNVWQAGKTYHGFEIDQKYLQNIFCVKDGYLFTLMHLSGVGGLGYIYCTKFSDMSEKSKLDVTYYTGRGHLLYYDWDWTSVSAMNQQTGVIAIFRYYNEEKRNYAGCFNADPDLGLLCDVPLYSVKHDSGRVISDEPQIWPMPE